MRKLNRNLFGNRGFFVFTLLVGMIFSGVSVVLPTASGEMISAVVAGAPGWRRSFVLFIAVGLAQIFFSMLDNYMGRQLQLRQKRQMRRNAFAAFSRDDSAGREQIADFVSFVNNDIPVLVEQYFLGTIDIVKCVCILVFSSVSLLWIHWILALAVAVTSLLIVFSPKAFRKKGGEARAAYSRALGTYNTGLQSFLEGLRVIKAYGYHARANAIQEEHNQDVARKEGALIRCQLAVYGLTSLLQVSKTLVILILGVLLIAAGEMEIGGLLAVVQLTQLIAVPIEVLAYLIHGRGEVLPLLDRYEEITDGEQSAEGQDIEGDVRSLATEQLSFEVEGLQILKNVSVAFEAGKNYLITGESGSGKSTLLGLLAQSGGLQYDGRITCNGREIGSIYEEAYHRRVCPVFQEPYLFYLTLEENILLGRNIADADYYETLKKLNLEYLVERYHGQELTPEILEQLSGGERQRVALARALVGKPEFYLLDEVTSALDAGNSEAVEEMLLREDAAVIHICHKPNPRLLHLYWQQLVMNDGELSVI